MLEQNVDETPKNRLSSDPGISIDGVPVRNSIADEERVRGLVPRIEQLIAREPWNIHAKAYLAETKAQIATMAILRLRGDQILLESSLGAENPLGEGQDAGATVQSTSEQMKPLNEEIIRLKAERAHYEEQQMAYENQIAHS